MATPQHRVDYDAIAPLYDAQPYRAREPDAELLAFMAERNLAAPAVLDLACGTGNQLIANRGQISGAELLGLDRSAGMLRQARRKAEDISWVCGDSAALPFARGSFDFVSCQFAFHHFGDKIGALRAVLSVLRAAGRFVLHNMCPQLSQGWLCYEYFPAARERDLADFWPPEMIVESMNAQGFVAVRVSYRHLAYEQNMESWLKTLRRRDTCSQLLAIPEAAYQAGITRLAHELANPLFPPARTDRLCLVTIRGEAPAGGGAPRRRREPRAGLSQRRPDRAQMVFPAI
jgi:ubiquinone/menaquinone biosynthesis C-methylase UbiE